MADRSQAFFDNFSLATGDRRHLSRRLSEFLPLTLADVEKLTINAMKSAFVGYDERLAVIYERIKPGYAKLRGEPALAGYRLPPSA